MSAERKLAIFNYWFENKGHWIFGCKGYDKALEAWKTRGIEGIPNY
jgi:hypothetical protein